MKNGDFCRHKVHKLHTYKILDALDQTVIAKDITYDTIEVLRKTELEVVREKRVPTIEDVKAKLTLEEMRVLSDYLGLS